MSGDTPRDQDQEFEDFILEDAPVDDLESLFEPTAPAAPAGAAAAAEPDADDMLFEHREVEASEKFGQPTQFQEQGGPLWKGHRMSAEEIGIPVDAPPPAAEEVPAPQLDALLEGDEEFSVDGDAELELVDDDSGLDDAAAAAARTMAADGDDVFAVPEQEEAADAEAEADFAAADDAFATADDEAFAPAAAEADAADQIDEIDAAAEADEFAFGAAATDGEGDDDLFAHAEELGADADAELAEPAFAEADELTLGEPMPEVELDGGDGFEAMADELAPESFAAEVSDLEAGGDEAVFDDAPVDEEPVDEAWAPVEEDYSELGGEETAAEGEYLEEGELVGVGAEATDDQQNYLDTTANRFVGAPERRGRGLRMVASLAAALLVLGAGGVVVLRPEWFGLRIQPDLVQRLEIARPVVDLRVDAPPAVEPPRLAVTDPTPTDPRPTDPVAVPNHPTPTDPVPQPTDPTPTDPRPTDPVAMPNHPTPTDPVAQPTDPAPTPSDPVASTEPVIQVSETLALGGFEPPPPPEPTPSTMPAIANVMPGTRAFAQLRNGNFFIGSVKQATDDCIVLRMEAGELTLPLRELQRLTGLGTEEYGELQRATTGYIKLNNSSRFVGTILKSIADDHVILQLKSDRVMLPRAAIEEIGDTNREVLVGGSHEEDQWLQKLVEQQMQETTRTPAIEPGAVVVPAPPQKSGPAPTPNKTAPKRR